MNNMENDNIIEDCIILETNDNKKLLCMKNFSKDAIVIYSCQLIVNSLGFNCDIEYCFDNFLEFIAQLNEMNSSLKGEAILKEEYDNQYLKFSMNHNGHVLVEGCFQQTIELSQKLQFGFKTDQTCLSKFIFYLQTVANKIL